MPEVKPVGGGSAPAREERLACLIDEIQENRMGAMRTAKALAEFAWATGAKLREARELVGGDTFIGWLSSALGISRREAAALVHFSRRPKFDASPVRTMTLGEALELVALLCDEYRDWPKTSGVAAKPKAPRPAAKPR